MNDENPKPPFWYPILEFIDGVQVRVGDALGTVAEFLEWGFGTFVHGLTSTLTAPLRFIAQSRFAKSTQEATDKSMAWLFWLRETLGAVAERIFPRRFFWPLHLLAERSEMLLYDAFEFGTEWFYSRDFRKLLWAIPAAMLAVPLTLMLILGLLYSPLEKVAHYETARREAVEANDKERAQFLLARLSQLGYRREKEAKFATAISFLKDDKKSEAVAAIRELAPETEPGFAPAHLWLAAAVLDGELEVDDPWESIQKHSNYAIEVEPDNPLAKRFLVECKMEAGDIDEAVDEMYELRDVFPDLNAELAHQLTKRGEPEKARRCARQAVTYHERRLAAQAESLAKSDEQDDTAAAFGTLTIKGYQRVAEAYRLVNQYEDEITTLRRATEKYPTVDGIRQSLIDRLVQQVQNYRMPHSKRMEFLRQLLDVSPLNETAMRQIIAMVRENGERDQAFLQSLASNPNTPPATTKAMGDVHLGMKQYEKARKLYEVTCERNDKMAYSWNNLAWINSHVEPIDLNKALELTDRALDAKQDANFFETRGQILVKMERWKEAVQDLEQAIRRAVPNPENAHRSLAMIYEQLNEPERAAAHRAIAEP